MICRALYQSFRRLPAIGRCSPERRGGRHDAGVSSSRKACRSDPERAHGIRRVEGLASLAVKGVDHADSRDRFGPPLHAPTPDGAVHRRRGHRVHARQPRHGGGRTVRPLLADGAHRRRLVEGVAVARGRRVRGPAVHHRGHLAAPRVARHRQRALLADVAAAARALRRLHDLAGPARRPAARGGGRHERHAERARRARRDQPREQLARVQGRGSHRRAWADARSTCGTRPSKRRR